MSAGVGWSEVKIGTAIAHEITGVHWSGPRFFGLHRKRAPGVQEATDAA